MLPARKIIIDTDPGVDDAIAILMALADPSLDVLGLTTVGGNVSLAQGTRNALALLEYAGASRIPVVKGASRPRRGKFRYSHDFHGRTGLTRRLPRPSIRPAPEPAVDFLAAQLKQWPGQVTLLALGPLTNLARLHRKHPSALDKLRSLVVMGGAVGVPGNVTPHAEFNFYSDPVAAQEVMATGVPMTLVDLSACRQVGIARDELPDADGQGPLGWLTLELLWGWFDTDPTRQRFEFYDPLTLAAFIDPAILTVRPVTLDVECRDADRWGESRVIAEGGPVLVVDAAAAPKFFALLDRLLGITPVRRKEDAG
jgi:inosine-uridine nucleoside N-ribohydrolase